VLAGFQNSVTGRLSSQFMDLNYLATPQTLLQKDAGNEEHI